MKKKTYTVCCSYFPTRCETSHHTDHIVRLDSLLHSHQMVYYSKHTYLLKSSNSFSDNEGWPWMNVQIPSWESYFLVTFLVDWLLETTTLRPSFSSEFLWTLANLPMQLGSFCLLLISLHVKIRVVVVQIKFLCLVRRLYLSPRCKQAQKLIQVQRQTKDFWTINEQANTNDAQRFVD